MTNLSTRPFPATASYGRRLVRLGAQLCAADGTLINRDYERAWLPDHLQAGATSADLAAPRDRERRQGMAVGPPAAGPESAKAYAPVKEPASSLPRGPAPRRRRRPAGMRVHLLRPVWNETRPRVHGLEHLEAVRGPVMLVSNHASHLDAPLVLARYRGTGQRRLVGAAADYFFDVWWRSAATAPGVQRVPHRSGPVLARGPGRADGWSRTAGRCWSSPKAPGPATDGCSGSPRGLAAGHRAAAPGGAVAIRGAYAAMPRGRGWPRRAFFGEVRAAPVPRAREDFRALSRRIFDAVSQLMDEDRSTWWESHAVAVRAPGSEVAAMRESTRPVQAGGSGGRAGGPGPVATSGSGDIGAAVRHPAAAARRGHTATRAEGIRPDLPRRRGHRREVMRRSYSFPTKEALLSKYGDQRGVCRLADLGDPGREVQGPAKAEAVVWAVRPGRGVA